MRDLVAVVKATHSYRRMGKSWPSYNGKGNSGKGITSQNRVNTHKQGKDTSKQYQCWQCGEVGHLRRECPSLKDKGLS